MTTVAAMTTQPSVRSFADGHHVDSRPRIVDADRGTCRHCPASADGCNARRAAIRERCCRRCDHPASEVATS